MADTKIKQVGGTTTPIEVEDYFIADATTIYEGDRLLWIRRDTGYAQTSTYALANPANVWCAGVIKEHVDTNAGNVFNYPTTAGQVLAGRYFRGVFLLAGDGTISQSSVGLPVFLVSDVSGTNNGLPTVSTSSASGSRPLVGYVVTNPRGASSIPTTDQNRFPIAIGVIPSPAGIPATLVQSYMDDATLHTAAFTVVPGLMHSFNFQATANINFPAVTALIDGYKVALINQGTGATASTLLSSGTTNIGIVGNTTTGATAAGPTSLTKQTYVANYTLGAWIPGL